MLLEDNLVMIPNARLSYPNLTMPVRPKAYPDAPLAYSADIIVHNTDPVVNEIMKIIDVLSKEKWKEHVANVMTAINGNIKARSYGYGTEKVDKNFQRVTERYPDDIFYISAKAKEDGRPTMIRPDGSPVASNDDQGYLDISRTLYDGCRVNVIVRPWLRIANPGVSFHLIAIQFAGDDTKFATASTPNVEGMFGAVAGPTPQMGGFTPPPVAPTGAGVPDFLK